MLAMSPRRRVGDASLESIVIPSFTDRARLRSEALLEPYQESFHYVRGLRPHEPVVPLPSERQCRLEALVIGRLRHLLDTERGQPLDFKGLEPKRISAGAHDYTLLADPRGLAGTLSNLIPTWSREDGYIQSGIAGLRYGDYLSGAGVSFFFPGQRERFTVLGVSLRALVAHRSSYDFDDDTDWARPGDAPHLAELATRARSGHQLRPLSAIARRLGFLVGSKVDAIDSWWSSESQFSVELLTPNDRPNLTAELVQKLQSPHFSPQLRLDAENSDHYNHFFEMADASVRIDLRYHAFSSTAKSYSRAGGAAGLDSRDEAKS